MRKELDCSSLSLGPLVSPWRGSRLFKAPLGQSDHVYSLFTSSRRPHLKTCPKLTLGKKMSPSLTHNNYRYYCTVQNNNFSISSNYTMYICTHVSYYPLPPPHSFNRIDIPHYRSVEQTRDKLKMAIDHAEGFYVE